jgi:hypothetical protein
VVVPESSRVVVGAAGGVVGWNNGSMAAVPDAVGVRMGITDAAVVVVAVGMVVGRGCRTAPLQEASRQRVRWRSRTSRLKTARLSVLACPTDTSGRLFVAAGAGKDLLMSGLAFDAAALDGASRHVVAALWQMSDQDEPRRMHRDSGWWMEPGNNGGSVHRRRGKVELAWSSCSGPQPEQGTIGRIGP